MNIMQRYGKSAYISCNVNRRHHAIHHATKVIMRRDEQHTAIFFSELLDGVPNDWHNALIAPGVESHDPSAPSLGRMLQRHHAFCLQVTQ